MTLKIRSCSLVFAVFAVFSVHARSAHAQVTVRSGTGANAAAIAPTRDQFRVDLGGGTTAAANGSYGGLRREVNWDGVPAPLSAPNNLPADFFNTNSPRGLVLVPGLGGSGFQVSGASADGGVGQPAPANFGNLNVTYTANFQTFSAQRLVTSLGNNVYDVIFFLPGTNTPAQVTGFGMMFTDVDVAGATELQFFDINGVSLALAAAPPLQGGFSFLGGFASNDQEPIARVRVTLGNTAIGPNDNNTSSDIVVADDFIYSEPRVEAVFKDGFE